MEKKEENVCLQRKKPLVVENLTFYPANDFRLRKEDHQKFLQEIGATENMEVTCLKILKERLERDKEIRYNTDENFLLGFLRFRKLDCEKTYAALRKLYSSRKKYPELFLLPPNLETLVKMGFLTYLPYKDEEGRVMVWVNYSKWKIEDMSFYSMMQMGAAVIDTIAMNPSCQAVGIIYIWDTTGMTVGHVKQCLSPKYILYCAHALQEVYPLRIKRIIVVNSSKLFRITWSMIRPFVKKKLSERIIMLGSDITELHQYVNPALLPKVYGGTLEENEFSTTQDVLDNLPNLENARSFGCVDES